MIVDLHIHSKYSRACSKDLNIDNLEKWARIKGVGLLGTGDFTHPIWIQELKSKLEGEGIYKTKTGFPFVLQSEVSLVYIQGDKGRRVHLVVLAPNFEVVDQITEYLKSKGRVDYDGRPIFKIPCIDFVEKMRSISDKIEVIPAHIWTSWFGVLGSKSGFNSIKEAFGDQVKYIHAIETGLSSDPGMNWRVSELDKYLQVSFSDLHSFWPWRLGREATIFDIDLSYDNLIKAIRTKKGVVETIEVDPAYGKYHWDGHRSCGICLEPKETKKVKSICPKCGRGLTIGVDYRVEELADRDKGFKPSNAINFKRLIPLTEILSKVWGRALATKTVWREYNKITSGVSEYEILLGKSFEDLKKIAGEKVAKLVIDNREGKIKVSPGADGVYGKLI